MGGGVFNPDISSTDSLDSILLLDRAGVKNDFFQDGGCLPSSMTQRCKPGALVLASEPIFIPTLHHLSCTTNHSPSCIVCKGNIVDLLNQGDLSPQNIGGKKDYPGLMNSASPVN